ncbi:hypothetical protein OH768_33455 [Streptomyces sp. NBC_01622]|uniref:hypothetical protein n=1 Tax=Streptomyces sp. NBC_01622 TaxID=2975903 RepID=UPI00386D0A54|nr:hypothetical protein OH768_33455 [Streptomyces sp. NBC_01622]
MYEGAVLDVHDRLLPDRVAPVITFGVGQREWRVGERGAVTPGREQLALPVGHVHGARTFDAADDQAGGDLLYP